MASSTITIRLDDEEKEMISDFATALGSSVSEFIRSTVLEKIEDELDLGAWENAKAECKSDSTTISAAEVARKYV